jgi:hypothetical protein
VTGSATTTQEQAARIVELLKAHFFTRTDKVAAFMPWDSPHPIEAGDELEALLLAHVMGETAPKAVARYSNRKGATKVEKGRYRIGSYTPDAKGKTRWLCLDFDGGGHADGLVDPEAAVLLTHEQCRSLGLQTYLECSGGGKGWHLWVFFSEPMPAKEVRKFAHLLVPRDQPLASGRFADARVNRGIEVFPKQNKIKKEGYGNLVWLPFWSKAPEGANQFYHVVDGVLQQYDIEALDTVSSEDFARALKSLSDQDRTVAGQQDKNDASGRAVADDQAVQAFLRQVDKNESAAPPPSDDWQRWREKALANLPIEQIYGNLLTGENSGEHWLRCQDPDSPSGPESRSGSVADGNGEAPKGTFHSFRTEETMSVFDFMVRHGLASSFQEALKKVAGLSGVPLPARSKSSSGSTGATAPPSKGFPRIVVNNRQLRDIIWESRQILNAANASRPFLFQRSGRPVRLLSVNKSPQVDHVEETAMYGIIARAADWVKRTDDGDFDVPPPLSVAKDLVANPDPSLPILDAVVTAPVFDENGNLASRAGYHRDAGIWYHEPAGFSLSPVPDSPTQADIDQAKALILDDLFVDFPFVTDADRAHAVAALILPFVRRLIPGPTPIHLFEAQVPGAGKTLMAEVIYVVTSGEKADPTTLGRDDEETRKKITSMLSTGRPVVLIDNVRAGIDSANLAAALTAEIWTDRLLGQNRMVRLPNRVVWLVTANNPNLSLEIARRSVRIRIEPQDERPWQRAGFKHSPLKLWAAEHRNELVWAVLVLVRAWQAGGSPMGGKTLGSFEPWAGVVGGILEVVGIPGFLDNTEELYEAADIEGQEWREFVQAWWNQHGGTPIAAKCLLRLALDNDMMGLIIGSKSERSQAIRLGKSLVGNRNRKFGQYRIATAHISHNQRMWRLVEDVPLCVDTQAQVVTRDTRKSYDADAEAGENGAKGGCLLPFERDIPPNIPLPKPAESLDAGDVGDVGDVNHTLAGAIRDVDTCEHAQELLTPFSDPYIGTPENIPHSPHIPKSEENQGDTEGDVREQHPPNIPPHPPGGPEIDLADLDEEEE